MISTQRIRQGRFADARRTDQSNRLSAAAPVVKHCHLLSITGIESLDDQARMQLFRLLSQFCRVIANIGLGQDNHWQNAGFDRDSKISLQPGKTEFLIARADNKKCIDIGGDQLFFCYLTCCPTTDQRFPIQSSSWLDDSPNPVRSNLPPQFRHKRPSAGHPRPTPLRRQTK